LIFVGVAVEWCLGFWAASYLKGLPGGSDSLAVAGAGAFQLAAVAGRLLSSRLTGRFGEKRILAAAIVATAVGFPLYWSLANPIVAIGGLMLCGMAVASFYPVALSLAIGAAGAQASKASSLATVGSGSAILVAPLALGSVADAWGLGPALLAIPVGLILMLGLLLIRRKG
jgi:fucose permease